MGVQTHYFYELTPVSILDAVESLGVRCTGRCLALNSLENRVYEVEIDLDDQLAQSRYDHFRVVKFYRPGRWNAQQILEEHGFMQELALEGLPVTPPLVLEDGSTLGELSDIGIFYAIFPRIGGRNLDEFRRDQLETLGRLVARLHLVGARREAPGRRQLNADTFGRDSLEDLLREEVLPTDYRCRYEQLVNEMCNFIDQLSEGIHIQRVHGDLHYGNVLWNDRELIFVDFDDLVHAPCVQDLWLIAPGRDAEAQADRELLVQGYEQLRVFDRREWMLVEPLRALRMIHFSAWIARRREDPAFKRAFTDFGTPQYWRDQLNALEEAYALMQGREW